MCETERGSDNNRARTAISRTDLSRPLKCAIADAVISADTDIFDYGCGRGDDLRRLGRMGYRARGWDPVHRPDTEHIRSTVVNLGYVVNVIENFSERCDVLKRAWALTDYVLIVSARLTLGSKALRHTTSFSDGCVTKRGTFQKFFEQQELRDWIDATLEVASVPAAPGIFYVFRSEQTRSKFIATRYRRRSHAPRLTTKSAELFSKHQGLLQPLMQFVTDQGRLPFDDELSTYPSLIEVFGSIRKAFRVVLKVTDEERWKEVRRERSQDLLVYLALAQFDGHTPYGRLPLTLRRDIKAFFGTYKRACAEANQLLFSLGKQGVIETASRQSSVGKRTASALYVHESALLGIPPVLRLYEGCGRGFLGRVEGANIIKLHLEEPMVSYLSYPEFDIDPHPALAFALNVHLQTFRVRSRDYSSSRNRPILHRKELFVAPDYPGHKKFARLTRIEESKGLYEDPIRIGFSEGWDEVLSRKGFYLRGHRLLGLSGQGFRSQ